MSEARVVRAQPLFERAQLTGLRQLRTKVDQGLCSEYGDKAQMTGQRPEFYAEPADVWREGETYSHLEWL